MPYGQITAVLVCSLLSFVAGGAVSFLCNRLKIQSLTFDLMKAQADLESTTSKIENQTMSEDSDRQEQRDEIGEHRANIARLFEKVNAIAVDIGIIRTTLDLRRECPQPGLCLELKAGLEEVRTDVNDLKTSRAEVRFGLSSWIWLGGVVVSVGGLIAAAKLAFG